jgi:hypothetical protein
MGVTEKNFFHNGLIRCLCLQSHLTEYDTEAFCIAKDLLKPIQKFHGIKLMGYHMSMNHQDL